MREITIYGAVEGIVDEAVLRCLVKQVEAIPGPVYGKNGKHYLLKKLAGFNAAAHHEFWAILVDLDQDADCAVTFKTNYLPDVAPKLCFRVAVREIEAWLLADRERIAQFLAVSASRIPHEPELLDSPKHTMVDIARHSRKRAIRDDMVPASHSSRREGNAYASRLIEFIESTENHWRPEVAAQAAPSLDRALQCLRRLAAQ